MRTPHFKKIVSRVLTKNRVVWILTFFFSLLFLAVNVPVKMVHAVKKDSAAAIYWFHRENDGSMGGAFATIAAAALSNAGGEQEVVDVTASGKLITAYKGGMVTALSDIGDSIYETPTGSAIIWAQDQFRLATTGQTFKAFAYDPNDTDIYSVNGYTALENTIGLWNWSRNIVYALFIIVLIAVAFMILFRNSLGGQQFVTLTNSLPSIVLSLVLITFSYPISAAFIDIVSIGSSVVYNIIIASPNSPGHEFLRDDLVTERLHEQMVNVTVYNSKNTPVVTEGAGVKPTGTTKFSNVLQPDDLQMSIWNVFKTSNAQVCGKLPLGIGDLTGTQVTNNQTDQCQFTYYVAPAAIRGQFQNLTNTVLSAISGSGVENVLVELALVILVITTQFKLLKQILQDYLVLSFFPIVSPWLFLIAAMPNRTTKVLTDYVKILGSSAFNLIIIYACFLILIVLGYTASDNTLSDSTTKFQLNESFKAASQLKWVPPMLGYSYGQIVGDASLTNNKSIITTIIIIAFFMAIPRIPEEIQSWMQVPQLPALLRNTGQDLVGGVKTAGSNIVGGTTGVIQRFNKGGK